ncbi:MAG: hypothetical protein NWQ55_06595 [Salibacteraceae bacterium]|jgi:hypothetical protein|nr:hypothetical protein [Salibacteraceae bacterium]MDP4964720.1 hypothetical protein [Salibacteraceae bacterium]
MEDHILIDEEIAEKSEFEVEANDFYLLTGSVVLLILYSLFLASEQFTGNFEVSDRISQNFFLSVFVLGLNLFIVRFRMNIYKACNLSKLFKTSIIIVIANVLQEGLSLIAQTGLFSSNVVWLMYFSRLPNITLALCMLIEAIMVLRVPKSSISERFKYLEFFSIATLASWALGFGSAFIYQISNSMGIEGNDLSVVWAVLAVLYSLPDLFLIKAAQPTIVSITEQNPEI